MLSIGGETEANKQLSVYSDDQVKQMLTEILNELGLGGSRHDEKRLYIIEAPGDKHPDFSEEHANVIWPELKPQKSKPGKKAKKGK